jgi:hypothetical protein
LYFRSGMHLGSVTWKSAALAWPMSTLPWRIGGQQSRKGMSFPPTPNASPPHPPATYRGVPEHIRVWSKAEYDPKCPSPKTFYLTFILILMYGLFLKGFVGKHHEKQSRRVIASTLTYVFGIAIFAICQLCPHCPTLARTPDTALQAIKLRAAAPCTRVPKLLSLGAAPSHPHPHVGCHGFLLSPSSTVSIISECLRSLG